MRPLAGELLLAAWERGAGEPEQHRPLALLTVAVPGSEEVELAELPLARLNLLLLRLHELSFGPELEVFGTCASCSAPFELSAPTAELIELQEAQLPGEPLEWSTGGVRYRLRPVTVADLVAVLATDAGAAPDELLMRCLTVSNASGAVTTASTQTVLERFDELNAGCELALTIACPECSAVDSLDLDLGRFLWAEVRHAAARLLVEVHTLASAYGWSERSLLGMGARRRASYLELLRA
jgi:hypothetical protein